MSGFTTTLVVKQIDKHKWVLTEPLVYHSDIYDGVITVLSGFPTDFASVPEFFPILHKVFSEVGKPATVIHDYLLKENICDRGMADNIFREALECCGVGWKRYPMYWGVCSWTLIRKLSIKLLTLLCAALSG